MIGSASSRGLKPNQGAKVPKPPTSHFKQIQYLYCENLSYTMDLCGGYIYDSTSIRRAFDCLSEIIKVSDVTCYSRGHAIYLFRPQYSSPFVT